MQNRIFNNVLNFKHYGSVKPFSASSKISTQSLPRPGSPGGLKEALTARLSIFRMNSLVPVRGLYHQALIHEPLSELIIIEKSFPVDT